MDSLYPPLVPGLTIAIPTYNRPDDLARTLDVIIPQVLANENVYLQIYDNCSPQPLPSFSDPRIVGHPRVKLVRNRYNGGIDNIMKCFVNCETEWVWVLGDDDLPSDNAAEMILSKASPDCACMIFKIPSAKTLTHLDSDLRGTGLQGFFEAFEYRYMQMICLSASVYNIRHIREHISIAYLHMYCAAPHTLMALLGIEKGASWLCSHECIADYQIPDESQHWNRFLVFYGLPTIVPAFKLEASRAVVRKAIKKAILPKPEKFLPHMRQYLGKEDGDLGEIFAVFRASYAPSFTENRKRAWHWLKVELKLRYPKLPFLRKNL